MSSHSLSSLAARLLESGMGADKPVAVIEQATTPGQRVFIKDIEQCSKEHSVSYVSPTLIIIGDVVKLHARFAWYTAAETGAEYFESLPENVFSSNAQRVDHDS
jgi:siroheme synthase